MIKNLLYGPLQVWLKPGTFRVFPNDVSRTMEMNYEYI